jgi:hypothetical protein
MTRPIILRIIPVLIGTFLALGAAGQENGSRDSLVVVILRHGEKPAEGDNLDCQGLNRALQLPGLIFRKFGIPSTIYVPAPGEGERTKHARMFETAAPIAIRFNLPVDSRFGEKDSTEIAGDILKKKGFILVIWEHHSIPSIARALGINDPGLIWNDGDYDSIWMISFSGGRPRIRIDRESIVPAPGCPD